MSRITALLKAVPLCCGLVFVAAAEDECTIRIVTDDGDGDGCEEVQDVCNLDCVLATNEEGCEICECAEEPPPETCADDSDCRDGQVCQFFEACPPCAQPQPDDPNAPQCDVACFAEGRCVDVQPDPCAAVLCAPDSFCAVDESGEAVCIPFGGEGCTSDFDCGDNAFCDFSTCNADGTAPAPGDDPNRPDDGSGGGSDLVCLGTCVVIDDITCDNVLCDEGSHCVEGFNGPECVPNESECETDEQCNGGRCELLCLPMPDCPECDACMIVGRCVEDGDDCAALCGPGQECRIDADGSVTCEDVTPPPAECTSDADCQTGRCNAGEVCMSDPSCSADPDGNNGGFAPCTDVCWGYCVEEEPTPTSCLDDSECAPGEICEIRESCPPCVNGDPACEVPCFLEGSCVPQ